MFSFWLAHTFLFIKPLKAEVPQGSLLDLFPWLHFLPMFYYLLNYFLHPLYEEDSKIEFWILYLSSELHHLPIGQLHLDVYSCLTFVVSTPECMFPSGKAGILLCSTGREWLGHPGCLSQKADSHLSYFTLPWTLCPI